MMLMRFCGSKFNVELRHISVMKKKNHMFFRFWTSKTEPKSVGLDRFRFGLGSFFPVWLFLKGKNRTENDHP